MADVRRIIIIFVIAVLFTILVQVSIDAFFPVPDFQDSCEPSPRQIMISPEKSIDCQYKEPSPELEKSCREKDGEIDYKYDAKGCRTEAFCNLCYVQFNRSREKNNFIVFLISAIAGLMALIGGLYLPQKTNPVNEWVGSGFLLGGIATIFVGTIRYFGDMGRFVRPLIILLELILIIFLTYNKLGRK